MFFSLSNARNTVTDLVLDQIFETFGSVVQPFYSLRFPPASPPSPEVFKESRPIYYAPAMASFVFTREIRGIKGSDASNVWDEEVADNEKEWSDDEEEAAFKRNLKAGFVWFLFCVLDICQSC